MQMDIISAVVKCLDEKGVKALNTRQLNALIAAVDSFLVELGIPDRPSSPGMGLEAWFASDDTGVSSEYMGAVLGRFVGLTTRRPRHDRSHDNHPHDPADLGRCVRLLDAVPELRPCLNRMAAPEHGPVWAALVGAWDELESLYREEYPTGKAPRCYARMTAIIDAARKQP